MDEGEVPRIGVGGFDRVDASPTPQHFASWMDHQRACATDHPFDLIDVGPNNAVLDIGCGTGVDLDAAADRVGRAVGIDRSATMARAANDRGSGGRFVVAVADGQQLPFASASFDAVNCRAVLIHTPRPALTVAEMRRVLRPGGRAVLSEPDHGSHVVATSEIDVFERLTHHRRTTFRNPLIGRSLVALVHDAGLTVTDCRVRPILHRSLAAAQASGGPFGAAVEAAVAVGAISSTEAARYEQSLVTLDEHNSFLFGAVSIAVTASAP